MAERPNPDGGSATRCEPLHNTPSRARTGISALLQQLPKLTDDQCCAIEQALHDAWAQGFSVGLADGSGLGYCDDGFSTDNPYMSPEPNR